MSRATPQNWQRKCSETVEELCFKVGKALSCHSCSAWWEVCSLAHGDDFVFVGAEDQLKVITDHMATRFKVTVAFAGPEHRERLSGNSKHPVDTRGHSA